MSCVGAIRACIGTIQHELGQFDAELGQFKIVTCAKFVHCDTLCTDLVNSFVNCANAMCIGALRVG